GCLTSEDEERETWTAESLRVSGGSFGFYLRSDEKTSADNVSKVTPWFSRCEAWRSIGGTSSNVVISRFKASSST
ncbi:hypothetical protein, partial [Bradyrhizobium denitrificans]|uniref:hypothetical protein n=1 Tax=Bradyrhizobium denitrificans TaxID=2734912 RepID=UPI001AEEDCBF